MFEQFRGCISAQRLSPYTSAQTDEIEILTLCLFNTALCESFYPSLQFLEVGLRNAMHTALTFTNNTPRWYKQPFLCAICQEDIQKAEDSLRVKGKDRNDPGRIVAELGFGFWVRLFNKHYQIPLWNNKDFLTRAFPYATGVQRVRGPLSTRIDGVRRFRNRIFHHERIIGYDINKYHREILEMIGWISPVLLQANKAVDRFQRVASSSYRCDIKNGLARYFPKDISKSS